MVTVRASIPDFRPVRAAHSGTCGCPQLALGTGAGARYLPDMQQAMLVAAGYGSRLAPLTDELPKPAVPVANRPLASFALLHLHREGIRDFVVNTHHLAERLQQALQPWVPDDGALRFSPEPRILGTGGGLRQAWGPTSGEPMLAFNAKLLFEPDLQRLAAVHAARRALATLVLRPMPPGAGFGGVDVDAEGRVVAILASGPPAPDTRRRMFTGVHLLGPRAHGLLPREGCVMRQGYIDWLRRGETIWSVLDRAPWTDLGQSPGHYGEGNLALLDGRHRFEGITPDAGGVLVGQGADVGEACRLRRTAVGAGARVAPGIELTDCVVWPGARVERSLRRTIITAGGLRVAF